MDFITHLNNIPVPSIESDKYSFNDYVRVCVVYRDFITQLPDGAEILKILRNDPRVQGLAGRLISSGCGASAFSVEMLAMWLIWATHQYGADNAQIYLNQFLDAEQLPVLNVLWILGIEVDKEISICDGFKIVPIEHMPDSSYKYEYLTMSPNQSYNRAGKPRSAIVCECCVPKIAQDDVGCCDNGWGKFYTKAHEIAFLLNAFDGIWCLPHFATSDSKHNMPMGLFGGSGGSAVLYDVVGHSISKLNKDTIELLSLLMKSIGSKSDSEKEKIMRILFRFSQAKRGFQMADKILDLAISLEMALSNDNDDRNEQLKLLFSLRGGWFIGSTGEERKIIFDKLGGLYKYRSRVAHGGSILVKDAQKVQDNFDDYLCLAGKIIRKLIMDGTPDWKSLVLGDG